jgi:hypothetical protein
MLMIDSKSTFTPGPWQFVFGDLFDHSDDGDANGSTILMAGASLASPDEDGP